MHHPVAAWSLDACLFFTCHIFTLNDPSFIHLLLYTLLRICSYVLRRRLSLNEYNNYGNQYQSFQKILAGKKGYCVLCVNAATYFAFYVLVLICACVSIDIPPNMHIYTYHTYGIHTASYVRFGNGGCFGMIVFDIEPDNFPRLMELMYDMQQYGQPPADIIKDLAPGIVAV